MPLSKKTPAMGKIIPLLFFYKDSFDIKLSTKVDVLLKKEIKPNQHGLTNDRNWKGLNYKTLPAYFTRMSYQQT